MVLSFSCTDRCMTSCMLHLQIVLLYCLVHTLATVMITCNTVWFLNLKQTLLVIYRTKQSRIRQFQIKNFWNSWIFEFFLYLEKNHCTMSGCFLLNVNGSTQHLHCRIIVLCLGAFYWMWTALHSICTVGCRLWYIDPLLSPVERFVLKFHKIHKIANPPTRRPIMSTGGYNTIQYNIKTYKAPCNKKVIRRR